MTYQLTFSDGSFMLVDETYKMSLFRTAKSKKPIRITIQNYLKFGEIFFKNYVFIDNPTSEERIPLAFSLIDTPYDASLPMNMRLKFSEDIKVGDWIAGPDGGKQVKELHNGEEDLYELNIDGNTYTVNGGHILHLIDKENDNTIDLPVNIWILMDDEFKSHWAMEKIKE
jgi:hypothetical protein